MKTTLQFDFCSEEFDHAASIPWPMEVIPRIHDQIFGMGVENTGLQGMDVQGVSFLPDVDEVIIFCEPSILIQMGDEDVLPAEVCDHAADALEMFGWDIQRNVPTIETDPATGEQRVIRGEGKGRTADHPYWRRTSDDGQDPD